MSSRMVFRYFLPNKLKFSKMRLCSDSQMENWPGDVLGKTFFGFFSVRLKN